ncbi:hypothetical protein ACFXHA_05085 [Nocardia sp. NPDC059240]|uniref:hypothetical protein n=1 Tax=Nocardia sp. NPDC059240 TaxID=3346786 RepID=UPI003688E8ED
MWSAESGVDTTAPEIVVARAFFESGKISVLAGTKNAYPGYEAELASLLRSPQNTEPASLLYFDPPRTPQSVYGTYYWRVMAVDKSPDVWRITVCSWINGLTTADADHYVTDTSMNLIPTAAWVELRSPSGAAAERTSAGSGPERFPSTDVFRGWSVTNANLSADQRFVDQCSALSDNPVPADLRSATPRTFDKPLPALPPVPGWPS